jgi:TonB family protein
MSDEKLGDRIVDFIRNETLRFHDELADRGLVARLKWQRTVPEASPIPTESRQEPRTSLPIACLLLVSRAVVVPISVPQPVYPPIAESARVTGDVVVTVVVRPDGGVASAAVESGAPLLREVALKAAQQAQYECRGCTEPGTPLSLVFTFRIFGRDEPKPATGLAFDQQGGATVNVVGEVGYWWEGAVFSQIVARVRSPKCLWLWRCGLMPISRDQTFPRVWIQEPRRHHVHAPGLQESESSRSMETKSRPGAWPGWSGVSSPR